MKQRQYPNICSFSVFRVIKVRLGPQVLQEHLVPEGLQETQAEMGRRATQESRWDTCILSHMVFCACVCTEITHSTAVATHIWVTLCWRPRSEDQVQLLTELNPVLSVGFRYIAFASTFVFLADAPISVTWFQKYIDCLKVQSVVDKVHRSSTWVKVQIRIIKYYSSKSTAFSILLEWKYKSTRFFMYLSKKVLIDRFILQFYIDYFI